MSLICSPDEKPRLEARNGVDQLGYIDYLINTLRAEELRESHILEFHGIAVADVYPSCGTSAFLTHTRYSMRMVSGGLIDDLKGVKGFVAQSSPMEPKQKARS